MKKSLCKWGIVAGLATLGLLAAGYTGLATTIYSADLSKMTVAILAIFIYYTLRIGQKVYTGDKSITKHVSLAGDICTSLGLVGTVVGLITATSGPLAQAISDPTKISEVLAVMSTGVSTALYTTGAGIVACTVLRFQNRILKGRDEC